MILFLLIFFGSENIKAQCNRVNSISESFDNWKSIPTCWETYSGLSMLYAKNKRITFYSMMTPKEDMYFITPKLKAGYYTITMDLSDNGGHTALSLFSVLNPSDKKSFSLIVKESEIKDGKRTQTFKLRKDAHVGLKVLLNDMHQAVYLDNLSIQPSK